MSTELILILVVILAGFGALYWLLDKQLKQSRSSKELEAMVHQVFSMSSEKIAEQSKHILGGEKEAIKVDLDNKQKMLSDLVKQLQLDIKERQQEIRLLEQDRTKKFSELSTQMEQQRRLTDELSVSTRQLASVLSNNQRRGEWGERIIEDLLRGNGLIEGIHYAKQAKQTDSTLRPDITLLLPNDRNVPVDVKFPYAEMQKLAMATGKVEQAAHLKQFSADLRAKIAKVAEYIDPAKNTVDYAILFVPNEMVFSFLNQELPDVIDEAMGKRVLIVSPFTFLIVARTVMESYRNFMIGDKLKEVVKAVDDFSSEWTKFRDKFAKYGRSLDTLKTDYDELTTTRVRQLEKRITKIDTYRKGNLLDDTEKIADDQPSLLE